MIAYQHFVVLHHLNDGVIPFTVEMVVGGNRMEESSLWLFCPSRETRASQILPRYGRSLGEWLLGTRHFSVVGWLQPEAHPWLFHRTANKNGI